ncbi:hypothetical protein D3C80_1705570 [compost metagenome]
MSSESLGNGMALPSLIFTRILNLRTGENGLRSRRTNVCRFVACSPSCVQSLRRANTRTRVPDSLSLWMRTRLVFKGMSLICRSAVSNARQSNSTSYAVGLLSVHVVTRAR